MIIWLSCQPHDTWGAAQLPLGSLLVFYHVLSVDYSKYVVPTQPTNPKTGLWAATSFYDRTYWKPGDSTKTIH